MYTSVYPPVHNSVHACTLCPSSRRLRKGRRKHHIIIYRRSRADIVIWIRGRHLCGIIVSGYCSIDRLCCSLLHFHLSLQCNRNKQRITIMDILSITGITPAHAAKVSEGLQQLLADFQVYYTNLRGYHWHVRGPQFFTLHAQFEKSVSYSSVLHLKTASASISRRARSRSRPRYASPLTSSPRS